MLTLGNFRVFQAMKGNIFLIFLIFIHYIILRFVYSVDFSSNGKYIVSTGNDSTIRIWEVILYYSKCNYYKFIYKIQVDTGDEVRNFTGHYDRINTVVFSKDGRYLATGGIDKNIMIWDPSQGISIKTLGNIVCLNY